MKNQELKKQGIESIFVPYQIAVDMKSIEFNELCLGRWLVVTKFEIPTGEIKFQLGSEYEKWSKYQYLAPTFSQCFRFFREKYNIVHTVYSNASGYVWELHYNQERGGTHICDSGESGDCEMSGMFTTYEKAELQCLKKLIYIVKNK